MPTYDETDVGTELPEREFSITRLDLVRYAGASGDFNVIHWNERIARSVGLPDVIAHGMLTMATAARLVTDWVGDPAALETYDVRFSRPVVVPDDDLGATLVVSGRVVEKLGRGRVCIDLSASVAGAGVLTGARAIVRLSDGQG